MIKSIKYTKGILSTAIISSTILFSTSYAYGNNLPIIIDKTPSHDIPIIVNHAPIIHTPDYDFISAIQGANLTNDIIDFPIIYSMDFDLDLPELSAITYMNVEAVPELIEKDTSINSTYTTNISNTNSRVELMHWDKVREILPIGVPIKIHDILTGLTYNVQSLSNGLHADVETVTAADTEIMFETFGREWSWDVRPVWVTVGNYILAASINGQPHSVYTISDNNMDGHVCLHFYGSTTHNGNLDFARLHQDKVIEAWEMGK